MINLFCQIILSMLHLMIGKAFFFTFDKADALTPVPYFIMFGCMVCFNGFVISIVEKETKKKYRKARW